MVQQVLFEKYLIWKGRRKDKCSHIKLLEKFINAFPVGNHYSDCPYLY
jgi:hypothetical protein